MKKRRAMLIFLFSAFSFFLTMNVYADADGSLQLNPNIITGSDGGLGNADTFPIMGELFSAKMNQKTEDKKQDDVPEQRESLDFSSDKLTEGYDTDTQKLAGQLFVDYQPEVIINEAEENQVKSKIWYWLLLIPAALLLFWTLRFGQKRGKKKFKEKKWPA